MARITVEDCEKNIENRFDLVVIAAQRVRQIFSGDPITIDNHKDEKKSVIALREIADSTVSIDNLKEKIINQFRTVSINSENEEELEEILEEDTYNPYGDMEMKDIESSDLLITEDPSSPTES